MSSRCPASGAGRVCLALSAAAVLAAVEAGEDPFSAVPAHHHRLDLKNFERHRAKLKVGFEF
jgi:hypothetical protein